MAKQRGKRMDHLPHPQNPQPIQNHAGFHTSDSNGLAPADHDLGVHMLLRAAQNLQSRSSGLRPLSPSAYFGVLFITQIQNALFPQNWVLHGCCGCRTAVQLLVDRWLPVCFVVYWELGSPPLLGGPTLLGTSFF